MPIPTEFDRQLSELDQLHGLAVTKVKGAHWSKVKPNESETRKGLERYCSLILQLTGIEPDAP
jgi:hypothetical protein